MSVAGHARVHQGDQYIASQRIAINVSVGTVAWRLYKRCQTAPESYGNISQELSSLYAVLKECDETFSDLQLPHNRSERLATIIDGCSGILNELEQIVTKYESLGLQQKLAWQRMKWASSEIDGIRARMTSRVAMLNAFLSTSQARVEQKLEDLLREFRRGNMDRSIISSITIDSLDPDERTQWRLVRKEFEAHGITLDMFNSNRDFIFQWFTEAVERGRFDKIDAQEHNTTGSLLEAEPQSSTLSRHREISHGSESMYAALRPDFLDTSGRITHTTTWIDPRSTEVHVEDDLSRSLQPRDPLLIGPRFQYETSQRSATVLPHNPLDALYSECPGPNGFIVTVPKDSGYKSRLLWRIAWMMASRPDELINKACLFDDDFEQRAEAVIDIVRNSGRRNLLNQQELDRALFVLCYAQKASAGDVELACNRGARVDGTWTLTRSGKESPHFGEDATPLQATILSCKSPHGIASNEILKKMKVLLDAGADPNLGSTLAYAAWKGHFGCVLALLEKGADVNQPGRIWDESQKLEMLTPLAASICTQKTGTPQSRGDIVEILLTYGANPNLGEKPRPLQRAVESRQLDICKMLLEAGALY